LSKKALVLSIVAILLLFYGNNQLLITDNVEANYALTAKEMVESGDWLSPQIFGNYWFDKPVLFYWLTALAFKLFGYTEFAARFTPACFGLASLGLMAWFSNKIYDEKASLCSSLILMTSLEFFLISKSLITDSVFFFFVSLALSLFYLGYRDAKNRYWYGMYVALGFAVLTKGPLGIVLPSLVIVSFLTLKKQWPSLANLVQFKGLLLFGLVVFPWYGAMFYIHGDKFLEVFLGVHNYLRATVSEHPKNNVFYYYALVNSLAFFPWSIIAVVLFYQSYKTKGYTSSTPTIFLLLWIAIVFIFFQCMATKYVTYTYPLLFPASLLLGQQLSQKLILNKAYYFSMGTSALVYLLLVQTVAVPFTNYRSNKDLSNLLSTYKINSAYGVFGSYPTSSIFYGDHKLYQLVPQAKESSFIPNNHDWSSKNVMPYKILEENNYLYAIVDKDKQEGFYKQTTRHWEIIGSVKYWQLLRAKPYL